MSNAQVYTRVDRKKTNFLIPAPKLPPSSFAVLTAPKDIKEAGKLQEKVSHFNLIRRAFKLISTVLLCKLACAVSAVGVSRSPRIDQLPPLTLERVRFYYRHV